MKPNTESAPLSLLEDGWSTLCFHELFERQVARTPDAIAVSFQGRHLTYRDLNRRANQVGHYLQSVGIGPEKVVGMYWPRAENVDALLVLLMGILKAGGAYLYLDTDRSMLPTERMLGMVADARTSIILTQQRLRSTLPPCETSIVCHDAPQVAQAIAGKSERNPISGSSMTSLAYVIYTSGSTGQPKGVLLTHRGIGNLARSYIEAFAVRPGDRIAQFFSYSFDDSVGE